MLRFALGACFLAHVLVASEAYRGAKDLHSRTDDDLKHLRPDLTLLQDEGEAPDTTHKSWFERLGDSVWSVLIGLFVVIPLSIALLWVNERRAAQLETLLGIGQAEAETVEAVEADLSEYDGTLVHLNSGVVRGLEPVQDARFSAVSMPSGCIKLRSVVEVYQWKETKSEKKEKDSVGGGTTTKVSYHYSKEWCHERIDSNRFQDRLGHENAVKVDSLAPGSREVINSLVKYGEAHRLNQDLAAQLGNFQDAEKLVGDSLQFEKTTFNRDANGWYMFPAAQGQFDIGDFRAKVEYVLDGPASVLALQTTDKATGDRGFGPYRAVRRPLCGAIGAEELKQRRTTAANKGADELYQEEKCWDFGPFFCMCACCNIVTMMFAAATPPQIYSIWPGSMSKGQCFDSEQAFAGAKKWGFRLLAWLLLWVGFMMLFEPLPVVADIIPFVGPYIGSGLSWVIGLVSFFLTIAVATTIVSIAYLIYRPLIGMLYLMLTFGVFVAFHFVAEHLPTKAG